MTVGKEATFGPVPCVPPAADLDAALDFYTDRKLVISRWSRAPAEEREP